MSQPAHTVPSPAAMWAEIGRLKSRIDDLETALVRLRGEMRQDFADAVEGLKAHGHEVAERAARAAADAVEAQLRDVRRDLSTLIAKAQAAEDYRATREELEERQRARHNSELDLEIKATELDAKRQAIVEAPLARRTSIHLGILAAAGVVLAALAGLVGAAIQSHR